MVNANKTSLVGVRTEVIPECTCGARNFSAEESCRPNPCYNGGRCIEGKSGIRCRCQEGYDGPRCQMLRRTFRGNGFAWFPALAMCDNSHISLEFLTRRADGLLFYNGPITPPETDETIVSDFIALELENGRPRLLIDFGSGTLQLKVNTKNQLNDGSWHKIDIFWDTEVSSHLYFCFHNSRASVSIFSWYFFFIFLIFLFQTKPNLLNCRLWEWM